jgi:hypothetical protein
MSKTFLNIILLFIFLGANYNVKAQQKTVNGKVRIPAHVTSTGDTIPETWLESVDVKGNRNAKQKNYWANWTRLRNAVYVTYPYAKKAALIINDVALNLNKIKDEGARKKYLSTREKELKKEFTEPLTNLSVYQGKILMKLINRETNNTCYELIKEYRGGFSARFWQTLAWFFGSSLNQEYLPYSEDAEMEVIVHEVARMYGHTS